VATIVPLRTALLEPIAVPLIPVSGIALITALPSERVCITYFHEVPSCDPLVPIEHHVVARLLWPRKLLASTMAEFPSLVVAAETTVAPMQRVTRFAAH
jgi:hypothetical protein